MSWYQMRRGRGGEPLTYTYQEKKAQLEEFQRLDELGEIDLYYLDETGFCLIPSVPYTWQDIGEYLPISSRRSQRLNVLGIMNKRNHLETYISSQSINSDVVIACIDPFFLNHRSSFYSY
jgi:hypothetical protein